MSAVLTGVIVFGCVFGGALVGMFLCVILPDHHLNSESRHAIRLCALHLGCAVPDPGTGPAVQGTHPVVEWSAALGRCKSGPVTVDRGAVCGSYARRPRASWLKSWLGALTPG